ncbi:N-formylglutamate deformylase [soil metagenome]
MTPVEGDGPLVLGMPHTGTDVTDGVRDRLNATGRGLADTDWHVQDLYAGLLPGASAVRARFHRYVIDANRGPDDASLYPGRNTTGLVPLTDFDGRPIWETGGEPDAGEVEARLRAFHAPYHAALAGQIERVRARHGCAILCDCHSIRSRIPFLFDGTLPDLNVGTNGGTTCDPRIEAAVMEHARAAEGYGAVLNGRFRGGWTTRHYGRPGEGVHAIQMELAQSAYLEAEEAPWRYDAARAARLRPHLARILVALATLAPTLGGCRV